MQISLKWLEELLSIQKVNLDYLIEKLTLGGFEVEKIIEVELNGQKIIALDISATANRSDSLSIKGISKEISTLLNKPYKNSLHLNKMIEWHAQFKDLIYCSKSKKNYLSFLTITLEQLKNLNSPKWLQKKLLQSGLKPINNFIDFQNYIFLETGYPFETYDLNKIFSKLKTKNFNLSLIKANKNEKFLTNNNFVYNLSEPILTIKADQLTLSLAGISPHKQFAYQDETTSLLIEASIFDSTFIRQQSRLLGLRTDRSIKYEKSIKSNELISAIYKLITLLKVRNPNLICKIHTKGQIFEEESNLINIDYLTVTEILGPIKGSNNSKLQYINQILISKYLDQLKFDYIFKPNELAWQVNIPNLRSDDIIRPIDLIEEIGRLHGFNKFLTRLPFIKTIGIQDASYTIRKKFTSCLLHNGFNELIHYSLTNDNLTLNSSVELINPLLKDCSKLRSSLLPNLIKTVEENLKQSNFYIDAFEYGHVFSIDIPTINKFKEQEYVSGIFGAIKKKSYWSDVPNLMSWFEAKGKMEQILKQFNCLSDWKSYYGKFYKNILHPYRTAEIHFTSGQILGIFGQINPILAKKLNLSTNLYLFEFNFDFLKNSFKINKLVRYNDYSLYPKIVKYLSFIINYKLYQIAFGEIKKVLLANGTKFLTKVRLIDEYTGLSIPEGHISLCLQLTFQSDEKTLQTKEVDSILKKLELLLLYIFMVKMRN